MQKVTTLSPNHLRSEGLVDRIFALALDNQTLFRLERSLILRMAHIQQGRYTLSRLKALVPALHQKSFGDCIASALNSKSSCYGRRALVLTYYLLGTPTPLIAEYLVVSRHAVREFIRRFQEGGVASLLARPSHKIKMAERQDLRDRLFALMHAPPIEYDINRTTWTIKLLQWVLAKEGIRIGHNTIANMIRKEGYNFRKTRTVLTSNDPDYRRKLLAITRILRRLGPADRFFSVDEYGPFSIKHHGGRCRVRKGEYPTVPQYQVSKGRLIVTAALELSTNQVTHFCSDKKDTGEMIALLRMLLKQYSSCRRIYFSWDSASWHSSKKFQAEVSQVNKLEYRRANNTPMVKLAPLPARAQFLNVIESVFSGMSRSIVQNSDYESISAAQAAIDRYFNERNDYFAKNPQRAGKKIWGKELVPSRFSESPNCKDPRVMKLTAAGR
jgi:transposase